MSEKKVVIIGAGPAGLTAAYELLKKSDIKPIILETEEFVGGISRTVEHNGNRMDIGGHRFLTKSDRVNQVWEELMPIAGSGGHLRAAGMTMAAMRIAPMVMLSTDRNGSAILIS